MPVNARELHTRVGKLRKSLKDFPKDPVVDQVHDLRTRTRRVESILNALELDFGNEAKVLRMLKPLRRRAGKVRDMDVFTSYVIELGLKDDPNCVVRLVHHLGRERERQARKLHALVSKDSAELRSRLKDTRRTLDGAVECFEKSNCELRSNSDADAAPLHAVSSALRLSQELAAVKRLGRNNLHPYRIEVKRLRYVLEMADSDSGPQHELIGHLKTVQDAIGEWHDWLELSAMAEDILRHQGKCKLLQVIGRTAERKFADALRMTEDMRHKYLPIKRDSKNTKSSASGRVSGPLLVAASEIAA